MGAVAVVRVGITLGHLSGHHARGVRAQPRMHLSGPAESGHNLARERGGDGERGKGPTRPPRARPRPTTYLCLEPIGRPICPVACCVLRDERRGACADRGDARDHCRSRVMRCVVRCVRVFVLSSTSIERRSLCARPASFGSWRFRGDWRGSLRAMLARDASGMWRANVARARVRTAVFSNDAISAGGVQLSAFQQANEIRHAARLYSPPFPPTPRHRHFDFRTNLIRTDGALPDGPGPWRESWWGPSILPLSLCV